MSKRLVKSIQLNYHNPPDCPTLAALNLVAQYDHRSPLSMARVLLDRALDEARRQCGITDAEVQDLAIRLAGMAGDRGTLARRGRRAPRDGDAQGGASTVDQAAGAA